TGNALGDVRLWDPRTGQQSGRLLGHAPGVNAVVVSADQRRVLSAGDDGTLRIRDLAAALSPRDWRFASDWGGSLAVHPRQQQLAVEDTEEERPAVVLIDGVTGQPLRRLPHPTKALALAYS